MANNTDLELGEVDAIGQTVQFLLAYEKKGHVPVYRPSIFKVPSVQRDISPSSYNPRFVSIGPLHREAKNVQAMEARKANYLSNLLCCLELFPLEQTFEASLQKVTASIDEIKESYVEIKSYTDVELAKLMVIDGFFILEFVYSFREHRSDVLLSQSIIEDLVLLENQILFFVLQELFECTILTREPDASLIDLILNVLNFVPLIQGHRADIFLQGTTPDHILSLLHMCYRPFESIPPEDAASDIHSASELDRAGVKFKPIDQWKCISWPLRILVEPSKFGCFSWSWGKPTLRMPVMYLDDFTESITRNLIIYEQSSSRVPTYITSYVAAIDALVDTKEDIAMLIKAGVICSCIGSNEEAANIINNINRKIPFIHFFYDEQWNKLNRYYNGYWPKNIARLRRTYFSSPWTILALLTGIVLFVLNIVQTIFTIKAA